MSPLVSFIIPAYNEEKRIGNCISSLLVQTQKDFEIIIIDDGSKDNTVGVVNALNNPRIRLISQQNAGRAASRNRALELCRGKYIALQDADDWSEPDRLERQIALAEKASPKKAAVVGSAFYFHQEQKGVVTVKSYPETDRLIRKKMTQLVFRQALMPPTMLALRDKIVKIGGWRLKFNMIGEDSDLISRLFEHQDVEFFNVKDPVYHYSHNAGSVTNKFHVIIPQNMFMRYCERRRRRRLLEAESFEEYMKMMKKSVIGKLHFRIEYLMRLFIYNAVFKWNIAD